MQSRLGIPFASRIEPVGKGFRTRGPRQGLRFLPERFPGSVREFPVRASEGGVTVLLDYVSRTVRDGGGGTEAVLQVVQRYRRAGFRPEFREDVVVAGGSVRELGGTEDVSGQVGDGFSDDLPAGVRVRDCPVGKGFRNAASEGVVRVFGD